MKKQFCFIITVLILLLLTVSVCADQTLFEFSNTEVSENGTFDLYISLNNVPEFCYSTISLQYSGFEIMSYSSSIDSAVFGNNRRGEFRISIASSENYNIFGNVINLKCWTEFPEQIKFNGVVEEIGDNTFKNDFTTDLLTKQIITNSRIACEHSFDAQLKLSASSCKNKGVKESLCSICNNATLVEQLPFSPHTTGEWEEVSVSTCSIQGRKIKKCEICFAETDSELLPLQPHQIVDTVTAPTYTTEGYTTHKCNNCEYSYIDTYTPKLTVGLTGGGSGGGGSFTPVVPQPAKPEVVIIGASEWSLPELESAKKNNIIPVSLSNKNMSDSITREEFAEVSVMLYELLTDKKVEMKSNPFVDTNNTNIIKAYSIGITVGTSNTTFSPNSLLTRAQLVTMLYRVLNIAGIFFEQTDDVKFVDEYQFDDWAKEPIKMLSNIGVIKGIGDNVFDAFYVGSREHAVVVANRIAELNKLR